MNSSVLLYCVTSFVNLNRSFGFLADAFCSMMKGGNIGKQIIKVSE